MDHALAFIYSPELAVLRYPTDCPFNTSRAPRRGCRGDFVTVYSEREQALACARGAAGVKGAVGRIT